MDMCPVFLFDMSVIVFTIGSAAGEGDRLFTVLEMSQQVVVEELGSVVTIEA